MKIFGLLFLLFFSSFCFSQISNTQIRNWKYELEGVRTGTKGTYLVKVYIYSKKPKVDFELAKKMAVHGVIFKGFSGRTGMMGQPPLTNNPNLEEEKSEFFNAFFTTNGKYSKFINLSSDQVGPGDRIRVSKKLYKTGIIMSINKDALRADLENAGILKGLSDGF